MNRDNDRRIENASDLPRGDAPSSNRSVLTKRVLAALRPWLVLALVCILFSLHPEFRADFWKREYLLDIVDQSARNIVLAVGLTFVILAGGIDLSVGSLLALSGIAAAMALTATPRFPLWLACVAAIPIAAAVAVALAKALTRSRPRWRPAVFVLAFAILDGTGAMLMWRGLAGGVKVEFAIAVGLCVGIAGGLFNGVVVSAGRIPPFVATLGMMSAARGLTLYATSSQSVNVPFDRFRALGAGAPLLTITALVVIAGAVLLARFRAGRYILAIGGNEQAALLTGVSVKNYKTLAYVLSSLGAAIAGVLLTAKFGTASTGAGAGAELEAIAAVVIGGASLSGGKGTITGALVGALSITVITNGLVLVGIEPNLQQVILGGVIILTVFLDQISRRTR